jgi:hypothetical protein
MTSRIGAEIAGLAVRGAAIALLFAGVIAGGAVAQQPAKPKAQAAAPPAKPSAADSRKCVGVMSAIGDTFALQKIGVTVFGNELNHVPIDSWQIDNLVVGKISTFLSKSWAVQRINYPKGAFSSLDEDHGLFFNYSEELRKIVRGLTSSMKCGHYVAVAKTTTSYGTSNQRVGGLGIVEAGTPLWQWDYIYALYLIRLYDGESFAVEGTEPGRTPEDYIPTINGPSREVDKSWWPQSNAAQSAKLRDGIRSLLERSLDVTMPRILNRGD